MDNVLIQAEKDKFYFTMEQHSPLKITETNIIPNIIQVPLQTVELKRQNILSTLTKREIDIIQYLLRGNTAKEIGEQRLISYRTVEAHIENIRRKLQCKNKAEILHKIINSPIWLK